MGYPFNRGKIIRTNKGEVDIGLIIGPIPLFTLWSSGPYIYNENSSRLWAGVHNICKVVSRPILEVWTLGEGEHWELHIEKPWGIAKRLGCPLE